MNKIYKDLEITTIRNIQKLHYKGADVMSET